MSDINKELGDLQVELAKKALEKIKEGDAAWGRIARDLLRDNNITSLPGANPDLLKLADELPFEEAGKPGLRMTGTE